MWLRILFLTLLLVQATRPAGFYVNCDDCGAEVHLGDDDTWSDDDSSDDDTTTGDDDDDIADDDSADDDESAGDDDTTDEPWFTGACEDNADNLFGDTCGFEQTDSSWGFVELNQEFETICNESASSGECQMEVWINRGVVESDCQDTIDNDDDGNIDNDDEDCWPESDQLTRMFGDSLTPAGSICQFQVDVRVDGSSDQVIHLGFVGENHPEVSFTDDFESFEMTAHEDWTTVGTYWEVNQEAGTRRFAFYYGDLPEGVTIGFDNAFLVCS